MKKEEIPQDPSALGRHTKEVCYAVDETGNYVTELSSGWEIKATALDVAWDDIEKKVVDAKQKVVAGEASPLLFFMELKLMDLNILSAYTGFWKWTIKRHMKPKVFAALPEKTLQKYADLFEVSLQDLQTMHLK